MAQMQREEFPIQTVEKLRFGDTDSQGHINNAVFATLFESGRVAFLYDPANAMPPSGHQFVIAEITIKFMDEMTYPGDVTISTGVTRIGNSSFALFQLLTKDDRICAQARSVIVLTDRRTRKSAPLPDQTRARLTQLLIDTQ